MLELTKRFVMDYKKTLQEMFKKAISYVASLPFLFSPSTSYASPLEWKVDENFMTVKSGELVRAEEGYPLNAKLTFSSPRDMKLYGGSDLTLNVSKTSKKTGDTEVPFIYTYAVDVKGKKFEPFNRSNPNQNGRVLIDLYNLTENDSELIASTSAEVKQNDVDVSLPSTKEIPYLTMRRRPHKTYKGDYYFPFEFTIATDEHGKTLWDTNSLAPGRVNPESLEIAKQLVKSGELDFAIQIGDATIRKGDRHVTIYGKQYDLGEDFKVECENFNQNGVKANALDNLMAKLPDTTPVYDGIETPDGEQKVEITPPYAKKKEEPKIVTKGDENVYVKPKKTPQTKPADSGAQLPKGVHDNILTTGNMKYWSDIFNIMPLDGRHVFKAVHSETPITIYRERDGKMEKLRIGHLVYEKEGASPSLLKLGNDTYDVKQLKKLMIAQNGSMSAMRKNNLADTGVEKFLDSYLRTYSMALATDGFSLTNGGYLNAAERMFDENMSDMKKLNSSKDKYFVVVGDTGVYVPENVFAHSEVNVASPYVDHKAMSNLLLIQAARIFIKDDELEEYKARSKLDKIQTKKQTAQWKKQDPKLENLVIARELTIPRDDYLIKYALYGAQAGMFFVGGPAAGGAGAAQASTGTGFQQIIVSGF